MPAQACIAFEDGRKIAEGAPGDVAVAVSRRAAKREHGMFLVFDMATGAVVHLDWRGNEAQIAKRHAPEFQAPEPEEPRGPGRPKLGVVAREVTLLPRHWEWLSQQRGGASAALRRLVDEARRAHEPEDRQRAARERAYRFMSALASDWPEFEEASRALFAGDALALTQRTRTWPPDAREHLMRLAEGAFAGVPQPAPQP
jgi:hypothetical protein